MSKRESLAEATPAGRVAMRLASTAGAEGKPKMDAVVGAEKNHMQSRECLQEVLLPCCCQRLGHKVALRVNMIASGQGQLPC